jgi:hypothetical protein
MQTEWWRVVAAHQEVRSRWWRSSAGGYQEDGGGQDDDGAGGPRGRAAAAVDAGGRAAKRKKARCRARALEQGGGAGRWCSRAGTGNLGYRGGGHGKDSVPTACGFEPSAPAGSAYMVWNPDRTNPHRSHPAFS